MKYVIDTNGISGSDAQSTYVTAAIDRYNASPEGFAELVRGYGGTRGLAKEVQAEMIANGETPPKLESIMRQIQRHGASTNPGRKQNTKPSATWQDRYQKARDELDASASSLSLSVSGELMVSDDTRTRTVTIVLPMALYAEVMNNPIGAFTGAIADSDAAKSIGYEAPFYPTINRLDTMTITTSR